MMIKIGKQKKSGRMMVKTYPLHLMLLPGMILMIIFGTYPLFLGFIISMQKFRPTLGFIRSPWVGFENFKFMFSLPDSFEIFRNTLVIAVGKIILTQALALFFALLINESKNVLFKRITQTIAYLPHFLSWVVLGLVFRNILGTMGSVNMFLQSTGTIKEPIWFLASTKLFPIIMIITEAWKEFGYAGIIFIASLAGIDPELYQAAAIDGAGRFKRITSITIPGIMTTIALVITLQIGGILNAGFDQIYNLYSPVVYKTGDIIDTYVYRMGLVNSQYSIATAVGFSKSIISFILIMLSNYLAGKVSNYSIF
jgi:putative aldouronate transport system permease protein